MRAGTGRKEAQEAQKWLAELNHGWHGLTRMSVVTLNFAEHDKLGLTEFCRDLEAFIKTEQHFVEGSLVVSLNAPFGSGKTQFLKMWVSDILKRREADASLPIPVILNTWETDYCGDPLLAIVAELSKELEKHLPPKAGVSKIKEAAKDVAWFGLGVLNQLVAEHTGLDVIEAGEVAEKKREKRAERVSERPDLLKRYEMQMEALRKLKMSLAAVFSENGPRALVLVDELDRCRPNYAVEFLETIKHIFDSKQITFVLGVDKTQLRSSAQALFGSGLNFDEYYRKFAHRNVGLPPLNNENLKPLIQDYIIKILVGNEARPISRTFARHDETTANLFEEILLGLRLTPRQIHEVFRLVGHTMATDKNAGGELIWGFRAVAILMAGLSVGMPDLYRAIGHQTATMEEVGNKLRDILPRKRRRFEWWLMLMASASYGMGETGDYRETLSAFRKLGLLSGADTTTEMTILRNEVSKFAGAWGDGYESQPFDRIYKMLEKLKRFEA